MHTVLHKQPFNMTSVSPTFAEQFEEGRPGQGASDLQPLGHHGRRDELVVRDFFVQLVISRLVEEDQVVELVPDLSFGPLLLQTKEREILRGL